MLPVVALVLDVLLASLVVCLAVIAHQRVPMFDQSELTRSLDVAGPLILLGWLVALWIFGAYAGAVFGAGTEEYKRVLNGTVLAAALAGVGSYLTKFELSRGLFVLAFGLGVPALLMGRHGLRTLLKAARRHGAFRHRVLIAGDAAHEDDVARVLQREPWVGYEVVGALVPGHDRATETENGVPVLGDSADTAAIFQESEADVIVVAGGAMPSATAMRELVWDLEQHAGEVVVAPNVNDISGERVRVRPVGGLPLLHIDPPRSAHATRWAKRTFDVVGASLLILLFSPVLAFAALRIKLHDRGPVLFRRRASGGATRRRSTASSSGPWSSTRRRGSASSRPSWAPARCCSR